MSVLDIDKVDFVAWAEDSCELVVSDHLTWDNTDDHLECLLAKINSYIQYFVDGQFRREWGGRRCERVALVVVLLNRPPEAMWDAFGQLKAALENFDLAFEVYWTNESLGVKKTMIFPPVQ